MSLLQRLFAPKPDPRDAFRPLWHGVVAEARRPIWYAEHGTADTVAGRFDMICAVIAVVLVRMETDDRLTRESVRLTELFVQDMDGQLREFGVGDVVVGKHMGKLMSAMGGRLGAYRVGLSGSDAELEAAIERNVTMQDSHSPAGIAREMRALAARLERTSDEALLAGDFAA